MDTNRVAIGHVYQIIKWEVSTYNISYTYERIKENALLFRQKDNTYLDLETKLVYEVNINENRQMGDELVFSNDLTTFNSFLDKEDRCSDMPDDQVIKVYQKVKNNRNDAK